MSPPAPQVSVLKRLHEQCPKLWNLPSVLILKPTENVFTLSCNLRELNLYGNGFDK